MYAVVYTVGAVGKTYTGIRRIVRRFANINLVPAGVLYIICRRNPSRAYSCVCVYGRRDRNYWVVTRGSNLSAPVSRSILNRRLYICWRSRTLFRWREKRRKFSISRLFIGLFRSVGFYYYSPPLYYYRAYAYTTFGGRGKCAHAPAVRGGCSLKLTTICINYGNGGPELSRKTAPRLPIH